MDEKQKGKPQEFRYDIAALVFGIVGVVFVLWNFGGLRFIIPVAQETLPLIDVERGLVGSGPCLDRDQFEQAELVREPNQVLFGVHEPYQVCVIYADGAVESVYDAVSFPQGAILSPDGTRIAFGVMEADYEDNTAIIVLDLLTGEDTRIDFPNSLFCDGLEGLNQLRNGEDDPETEDVVEGLSLPHPCEDAIFSFRMEGWDSNSHLLLRLTEVFDDVALNEAYGDDVWHLCISCSDDYGMHPLYQMFWFNLNLNNMRITQVAKEDGMSRDSWTSLRQFSVVGEDGTFSVGNQEYSNPRVWGRVQSFRLIDETVVSVAETIRYDLVNPIAGADLHVYGPYMQGPDEVYIVSYTIDLPDDILVEDAYPEWLDALRFYPDGTITLFNDEYWFAWYYPLDTTLYILE